MGLSNISGNILLTYPLFVDNVVENDTELLNGFMSILLNVSWEDYFNYTGNYLVFDTYGKAQFWKIEDDTKLPVIEKVVQNTLLYHNYIAQFENQKIGIDDLENPIFTHINYGFWDTAFENAKSGQFQLVVETDQYQSNVTLTEELYNASSLRQRTVIFDPCSP